MGVNQSNEKKRPIMSRMCPMNPSYNDGTENRGLVKVNCTPYNSLNNNGFLKRSDNNKRNYNNTNNIMYNNNGYRRQVNYNAQNQAFSQLYLQPLSNQCNIYNTFGDYYNDIYYPNVDNIYYQTNFGGNYLTNQQTNVIISPQNELYYQIY